MKKNFRTAVIAALLFAAPMIMLAQGAPPLPNGGNAPTGGNGPVGGGAPVGSGVTILLVLAGAYASRKVYQMRNKESVTE